MDFFKIFEVFLGNYHIDQKWYPFIIIGIIFVIIFVLSLIFAYIRSFIIWLNGVNDVIRLQEENNKLLAELRELQEQQLKFMEALFVANCEDEEFDKSYENNDDGGNFKEENEKRNEENNNHDNNQKKDKKRRTEENFLDEKVLG